ncbi:NCS2 family permease, partial [Clostridium botulinum]|nr:NCS2 family permease [Clostridium botulinum]
MGGRGIKEKDEGEVENKFNSLFNIKKYNTTVKGEILAGFTSFFAIVYIIAVNASILSDAGLPLEGAIIATVLSSFVGCI